MQNEIKAGELRLGNYIYTEIQNGYDPKGIVKVTSINAFDNAINHWKDGPGSGSLKVWQYQGIPITPEILENAGFESNDIDDNWTIYEDEEKGISGMNIKPYLNGYAFNPYGNEVLGVPCYYLHQLQNLYFVLTNQELTVNL